MGEEFEQVAEERQEPQQAESEVDGDREGFEPAGDAETVEGETATPKPEPEEKTIPIKAVQEERRKRQEAKQEAEYWKKVALGESENPAKPAETKDLVKPKPDQFDSYDDYVEALSEYKAEVIYQRNLEKNQKLTREQIQQREEQQLQVKIRKEAEKAATKYPDFYDTAGAVTLAAQGMQAMYESELGTEIAYYLGKNPAEMERIQELSPIRQAAEIGKLEAKLAAKTSQPQKKEVRQPTKVEGAGTGFQAPKEDMEKLLQEAKKTGDWTKYLKAKGVISG